MNNRVEKNILTKVQKNARKPIKTVQICVLRISFLHIFHRSPSGLIEVSSRKSYPFFVLMKTSQNNNFPLKTQLVVSVRGKLLVCLF